MKHARGYITHTLQAGRSVPQRIQQLVIRDYCQQHGLEFLLSATEFEGHSIMLESIKEPVVVMYSIWCLPRSREARKRLYESGIEVHFAAENIKMNPEELETIFSVVNYQATPQYQELLQCVKSSL